MHHYSCMPILRRNHVFVLAWILFWTLKVFVAVQDFVRNEHSHALWKPILWESSSALTATLLVSIQLRWSRADVEVLGHARRWFLRQACWLPLYWIAFVPLAFGMRHGVYALIGETYRHDPLPALLLYESIKISIFAGLFTAIRFGVESYRALLEQKLHAEQANALLRQAQLQRLAQQMQPHFLFNALNTISALMYSDVDKADATLARLADVLRATLDLGEHHQAPLEAELRLARGYAAVMAERFAGRVTIAWQVDERLLAAPVPVLSLQPLIENVFKHTVERRRGPAPTQIAVAVVQEGGMLVLSVEDDAGSLAAAPPAGGGSGASSGGGSANGSGGGIGLANLRQRLAALYGEAAALTLSACPGAGVRAEIRLPCIEPPCTGPACSGQSCVS
jgi:two-component system LytT family sensor kinase